MKFAVSGLTVLLSMLLIASCSNGGTEPIVPEVSMGEYQCQESENTGRTLFGMWNLTVDPETMTVEAIPERNLQAHFNITDMVLPPNCSDCVEIELWGYDPELHYISIYVTLTNQFQITGYDVRAIIYTDDYGHLLVEEDSWTGFFDIPGGQEINPFMFFDPFYPYGTFPPGAEASVSMVIIVPDPPMFNQILFAVDASWPGNCKEPYRIWKFTQVDELDIIPGSEASIYVWVEDHQENVSEVLLNAPEITGEDWTPFTTDNGFIWEMELANNEGAEYGDYEVLIKATSSDSPHPVWKYETVKVTSSLDPDPVDITPEWLNFCPQGVFYYDDHAYVAGHWNGLHIFDVSDKANPEWVARLYLDTVVNDVYITNGCAYLATEYDGLVIVDITTPESPTVVGEFEYSWGTDDLEAVYVSGDYAYIAAGLHNRLFAIIDINPPEEAYEVGYIDESTGYHPSDVIVKGDYAYLAHSTEDVRVIDISDPESPTVVHNVEVDSNVLGFDIQGDYLYVANNWDGITIIDISTPELAYIVKTLEIENASEIRVDGGYAYVADEKEGVHIIDVDPVAEASLVTTVPVGCNVTSVDYNDGYVFLGDERLGLFIVDVDPPGSAYVTAAKYTPGMAYGKIAYDNGRVFVPDQYGGVLEFDVDPASSAHYSTRLPTIGMCDSVFVRDSRLYVNEASINFRIFDVTTPGIIGEITSVELDNYGKGVFVENGLAYVTSSNPGLYIIDIDPPETASVINTVDGTFREIIVLDGYAYTLDYSGPLHIVDVDPVESAYIVHTVELTQSRGLDVVGNYAYVAADSDGLKIVDISTPETASVVKTIPATDYVYDVAVSSGYAYVIGYHSVEVYDISDLDMTPMIESLNVHEVCNITLVDNMAYVAAQECGLRIIQLW